MKSTLTTGFTLIALVLSFSCTKEQAGTSAGTDNESSAIRYTSDDESSGINVNSVYTLYYDWTCTGIYSSTSMTVYADGTWTMEEGYSGLWVKGRGLFLFHFNNYETTYSGKIRDGEVFGGIMTPFFASGNTQGCFYMENATENAPLEKRIQGQPDAAGNPQ